MRKRLTAFLLVFLLILASCSPRQGGESTDGTGTAGSASGTAATGGTAPAGSAAPSVSTEPSGTEGTEEPSTEAPEPVVLQPGPQFEMVLITDSQSLLAGVLNMTAWESLNAGAEENAISHRVIRPAGTDKASFDAAVTEAVTRGARFVVMVSAEAAESFEEALEDLSFQVSVSGQLTHTSDLREDLP